jgi:zinc transporter ZupT
LLLFHSIYNEYLRALTNYLFLILLFTCTGKDDEESEPTPINMPLVLSILVGDSLCNFCDGVFVGIALMLCDSSISVAVIGITLYHELAQELADYFLLTRYAGLTPFRALLLNFCTGLTVVFGGLLVLMVNLNNMTTGVLLAIASGVYIYIAGCECIPRVQESAQTTKDKVVLLLMFASGAIPIGLTLIGHVHCDAH